MPSARCVSTVEDFDPLGLKAVPPRRATGSIGHLGAAHPELDEGAIYKYEIIGRLQTTCCCSAVERYAFRAELRPNTYDCGSCSTHKWADAGRQRSANDREAGKADFWISMKSTCAGAATLTKGNRWLRRHANLAEQLIPKGKNSVYPHIELLSIAGAPSFLPRGATRRSAITRATVIRHTR